ncbi:DUF3598 family protein [Synechococcus sp. AH-551-E05]|nr:DUF3598 family protein [Synechococcus sp. AH-551-E05]MDB4651270.1 DUF3598 family protein [Synechococcus sp. AH-551-E05]
MHDPRASLLLHNEGLWQGCFMRLNSSGTEEERFTTSLKVQERDGVIENCLTYKRTGQQRSMNFETVPFSMQVNGSGAWSLGPSSVTPFGWVGELSVVSGEDRRRIVARYGHHGVDQVVYIVETKRGNEPSPPSQLIQCKSTPCGDWTIWQPESGVEILLDARNRQMNDFTACGLRWLDSTGQYQQIVRRYDTTGTLESLSEAWPSTKPH